MTYLRSPSDPDYHENEWAPMPERAKFLCKPCNGRGFFQWFPLDMPVNCLTCDGRGWVYATDAEQHEINVIEAEKRSNQREREKEES